MKKTILSAALACLALVLLIALNAAQRRSAAAELALTEETIASVAEAATELENMTLSLEKLLVTTSKRQMATLLTSLALSADRVQQDLAKLPDTQGQQSAVLAYLSRLTRLAQSCLADLAEESPLEDESRTELKEMLHGLTLLRAELDFARQDVLAGADASAALQPTELTAPPSAQELVSYKALPSTEVSLGEALQLAKEFVGTERAMSVAHAPDTSGALPAYGVTVQTPDVQLNVEVTRRGGKILLMAPETAAFTVHKSVEECAAAALAFLQSRSFAQMETTHYQVYDGLCVLTCAYVQNGVLIWPDRVLVQVRMDTAEVVGLEARSYWRNHIPRKLQTPLLTQTEARASLSGEAEVVSARLCLLPHNDLERLCWQFTLTKGDERYISYIDAMNGSELRLEKVVQLEYGEVPA